jgi:predicted alpha/beta-hydrolase family hydrolase
MGVMAAARAVDPASPRRARKAAPASARKVAPANARKVAPASAGKAAPANARKVAPESAPQVARGPMPELALDLDGHPGLLVRPAEARALYVLAHGAGAGMRHAFLGSIAGALAARGVATLRWEFPYMAAGKPRPDRADVAEAAVRAVWLAARARFADLAMFAGGKSFGGRMTSRAHAAAALPGLCGVIFLGFPLHPPDKPGIERADHLAAAGGPLLFIQGDRDELAGLRLLRPVVRQLGARAALHVIDAADHGFDVQVRSGRTRSDVLDEIADTVAGWIAVHAAQR